MRRCSVCLASPSRFGHRAKTCPHAENSSDLNELNSGKLLIAQITDGNLEGSIQQQTTKAGTNRRSNPATSVLRRRLIVTHAHRRIGTTCTIKAKRLWGRHMGIKQWLLVWLIVNALFVVWRAMGVSYEMETRDRSPRKMPTVADL